MKFYLIGKKQIGIFLACAITLVTAFCFSLGGVSAEQTAASAGKKLLPIYAVGREDKTVSISFDAAWGNEDTQQLIDILEKYNVKATFFVVGQWVDKYPESVKALSDAGHEIMNHSNTHPHMSKLSQQQMIAEIEACNSKIEKITGKRPILFRAPYGEYCDGLITALQSINMYCIQWDVDSLDWKDLSGSEITSRVTSKSIPGSIVLFHNAAIHTPEALPSVLEFYKSNGYKVVPISENIYKDNFTLDHEGRQRVAAPTSSAEENASSGITSSAQ